MPRGSRTRILGLEDQCPVRLDERHPSAAYSSALPTPLRPFAMVKKSCRNGQNILVPMLNYAPFKRTNGSVAKLVYALVSGTNGKPCGFDSRQAHQKCSWWNWQTRQVQTLVRKHAGSTPAGHTRRVRDGTGRRIGPKPRWRCLRAGSTPAGRTLLRQGCGGQVHVHPRWTFATKVMV